MSQNLSSAAVLIGALRVNTHKQLSYGDVVTALLSLIRHIKETGQPNYNPWFTKRVVYPLRALTHLFGNGAGAYGIGKISSVLAKIGKFDIVLMNGVSIARLIPIIKLTIVSYEKREIKKQV